MMRILLWVALMVSAAMGGIILNSGDVSAQLADSPWPMFKGNLQRTGLSPYDTSHVDGTILWSFQTGGGIESSPAIGEDGTIYVGAHDGYLYAVTKEGSEKWKIRIGTPKVKPGYGHNTSILSSPAIADDGTIYIASRDQYLFAISSEGKEKWRFPVDVSFDTWAAPIIGKDGTVYFPSSRPNPGLYAINPDGTEKWHFSAGTNMFNSPAIGKDGTIYAGLPESTRANKMYAINPDGTKKWGVITELFLESTPAIADDGTIYIGSFSEEGRGAGLYAISSSGKIKWHFTTPSKEVMSTPSIGKDGTIYVGGYDDNTFYAINPDGTEKWNFKTGGTTIGSSPAIGADGTIYVGVSSFARGKPGFYAFNPDGTVKWGSLLDSSIASSPAIGADGTIYVGSWDSNLYAFGGSPAEEGQVDVESKEEATPGEVTKPGTTPPEKKGVCGPTALLALALLPLAMRRLIMK